MPGFELFGDAERKEVHDVLESGVLMRYGFDGMRNGHWKALELEREIQERFKVKHAQLTTSGTTALTLALSILGVGSGDEVIMPTFTFVASFESIIAAGATPVLVDIDETLTLCPKAVEKAITPKTKVIMPVHMCGSMANIDALKSLCDTNLFLLEDACQAIGGSYKGKKLGSIGHAGCFSFDYVKTITCGEGGAVITNDSRLAKYADNFSDHGHDHIGNDRGAESHPYIGYNYRISELNAAVGLAQIRRLDDFIQIQEKNFNIIRNVLAQIPEVTFRAVPEGGVENYSFLSFFMPSAALADKVMQAFETNGIDGCWNYYENNWHYIRTWQHLKEGKSLNPLSPQILEGLERLKTADFSQSDDIIRRNISCLIKISWTEQEVHSRAESMVKAIKSIL